MACRVGTCGNCGLGWATDEHTTTSVCCHCGTMVVLEQIKMAPLWSLSSGPPRMDVLGKEWGLDDIPWCSSMTLGGLGVPPEPPRDCAP